MTVLTAFENAPRVTNNLDWTRGAPPSSITPYQKSIRDVDWSSTPFGPMDHWSRELRQVVLFMMAEVNPVILYWGPLHSIMYNEAHAPLVGKRHPSIQGKNADEVFPEFWSYFAGVIKEQEVDGRTRSGDASMLLMERHGFLEECYFDWKLIPVIGEDGIMVGAYGRPTELSNEVISSRRNTCIQSLAQYVISTNSFDELWRKSLESLHQNDKDIPIAMLYSVDQPHLASASLTRTSILCKLEGLLGIPTGHKCAEKRIDLRNKSVALAGFMLRAYDIASTVSVRLADLDLGDLLEDIEWRGFGLPVEELAIVPIRASGSVAAMLVIGINPRLKFTAVYQEFVNTIADVISPQISKLRLAEEVKSRDRIARTAASEFQRSEMRFGRFAERSPLGLSLTDKDGRIVYANEAWFSFCGLTNDEYEFSKWVDAIHVDDVPIINEWWHKVSHLQQSGTFQIRSKEPYINGDITLPYRTGIVALYPDLNDDGVVATVMGLITDISELKWSEEQLRLRQREIETSEMKYRKFAEQAPIGVVRTDLKGYVQFANNAWRSFYNFEQDQQFTEPQPWLGSLNAEDVPLAKRFFEDIATYKEPISVEVRMRQRKINKQGSQTPPAEFWLLASGFVEDNHGDSAENIVFWVTDITDQKVAEKVLTDKMEEAIRVKNTQERFVDMISHEIRNPLSAILHCGEEIIDAMRNCMPALQDSTQSNAEIESNKAVLSLLRDQVSSAHDSANTILYCTQHQKQIVDDVLTLSKLDADLLVVSPIPVQPMELVRTALKIFDPELKASLTELVVNTNASLQELDVDWIMLDPNRFLQIVINLVTNAIKFTRNSKNKRIVINVSARTDKPPEHEYGVYYVPRRETANGSGHDILDNGIDQASAEELYLCFSISDTGKGLSEAERMSLFKRFAQASPKTQIEYGGTGLGLFISRQITEMLGGEIGVGSEPGKGATFAFYVHTRRAIPPRRPSLAVEQVSMHSKSLITPTPGTWSSGHAEESHQKFASDNDKLPKRVASSTSQRGDRKRQVLVVEDNLVNQKVLCKQLHNRGFQVEAANHGREALTILHETLQKDGPESSGGLDNDDNSPVRRHFDVILCDIEMPIMDGIQCVQEIRRLENEGIFQWGHIPIIGVTANVRSKQVNAAIEAGMDGVTTKPYRIEELIEHIDKVSRSDVKSAKSPD